MKVSSEILDLIPPRYLPCFLKETSPGIWYDIQKDQYKVPCPQCRCWITYHTLDIAYREMVASERKCCQGCRAKISFEKNPQLIGLFLEFWQRTGNFPESANWLDAVPQKQYSLWGK